MSDHLEPLADLSRRQSAPGSQGSPRDADTRIVNAFSIDVEDYFHVTAFEKEIDRSSWEHLEHRVEPNTARLLELLEEFDTTATFFLLGWVAERHPGLVRQIRQAGHELAIHGYDHRRITDQTPEEFRQDVRKSKSIVEDIGGVEVIGYRAPSYSIVRKTIWSLTILAEEGLRYDSSIFPIVHDRYGIPSAPRHPWKVNTTHEESDAELHEFPISTVRLCGVNLPFVGGGYLRQLPMGVIHWGMRKVNRVERKPVVLYVHPWELDPDQPRQTTTRLTRFRHYRNLDQTRSRLASLLGEYEFDSVRRVLGM